jgi:hypothetical protein
MSLFIEMSFNGTRLATGTGFMAQAPSGPTLVTNLHNLTGRHPETGQPLSKTGGVPNEITILHNVHSQLGSWMPRKEALHDQHGAPKWIQHPTLGPRADIAALPLTELQDVGLYPYDPGNPFPDIVVGPADVVSVIGFPFGLRAGGALAIWATGFVASEPDIDYNDLPIFLIDCRSRPGQSGSPVISYRGGGSVTTRSGTAIFSGPVFRFLGVYSGRINEQSDIGIVWKALAVQELVASVR